MAIVTRLRVTRAQEAWIQRQAKATLRDMAQYEKDHGLIRSHALERQAVEGILEEIAHQRELRRIKREASIGYRVMP